ncbi:hypothetical protein C7431_1112 [Pantoea allii]|uniref:Uncharacterized protein n=1 Tax=Pantoea allii TaxID=574096 RepID=A0A2V2B4W1_9GAMM|nr:hypothetical protein C7431_1112 [Pantoea allii]
MTGQTVHKVLDYLHGLCDGQQVRHQVHIRMQQRLRDAGYAEKGFISFTLSVRTPQLLTKVSGLA